MKRPLGGAVAWLAQRLQPPGDAILRGLEQDLTRETTLDGGWWRVCETAWTLGFVELRLVPAPEAAHLLAERYGFAPRPWPLLDRHDGRPNAESSWAFGLTVDGRHFATVTARRRLTRVDFEPQQFVAAVQGLVNRFVIGPSAPHAAATTPVQPVARPASDSLAVPAPSLEP